MSVVPSSNQTSSASKLLQLHLAELIAANERGPILDLACGSGRNGLSLLPHGLDVVFADISAAALQEIAAELSTQQYHDIVRQPLLWEIDLEKAEDNPLVGKTLGAVLVFRYLHRPLIEHIKQAVVPGGLIIYETFTVDQPQYGRPTNPDFLLRHNELEQHFAKWKVLHYFEGVVSKPGEGSQQAIAQIVATKPA